MLRAIIIEDERETLDILEKYLHRHSKMKVIGKYTSPHAGLIAIAQEKPNVVFLDCDSAGYTSIELAKEVMTVFPNTKIVFLASSKEYAIHAFDLQATDYVLKPLLENRIMKTIERLGNDIVKNTRLNHYMIRCFKQLDVLSLIDGEQIIPLKWRTLKSKEIFAYLLHHHGSKVPKDVLAEMLWPKLIKKEAYSHMYTAIYHIRTSLKASKLPLELLGSNSGYELKLNDVITDVMEFRNRVLSNMMISEQTIAEHRQTLELYRGDYFEIENYSWAKNKQSRLHFLYVNYSRKIADYYMTKENFNDAIVMYAKLQKKLPYQEDSYFKLMKLYFEIGDIDTVKLYYDKLIRAKKKVRKLPSENIRVWYKSNV